MGDTGETYIVNRQGWLLTESRFVSNRILSRQIDTTPVRAAWREDKPVLATYKDYRGVETLGASAIIEETGWVIVTELDFNQATAPIRTLRAQMIFLAVVATGIGLLMAKGFNRTIIEPLRLAGEADRALARGEETAALVSEAGLPRDEIGDFITQRNSNVRKLFDRERELLKAEKCRAEAATALEALSYSMVHDMRAPLRTVCTFGDLLRQEAAERLDATQKDYLARMKAACLRMDHLICDMLRYSSMLHAEVPLSAVNVSELVQRVVDTDPALKARKAAIHIDGKAPLVQGNAALLTQCFSVLLDNGFKYAKACTPPRVDVWEEAIGDRARVIVADNGIGISEKFQKRLFGIFQKGIPGSQGTGIGLALVRVAIERMGGRVGVFSEEGKGSRFWLELKLAD
jgi:signal transduction histidine kinase